VNLEALLMYDTAVICFERQAFLRKWLRMNGSQARVAIDSEGSIVGYMVPRATFVQEGAQKGCAAAMGASVLTRALYLL